MASPIPMLNLMRPYIRTPRVPRPFKPPSKPTEPTSPGTDSSQPPSLSVLSVKNVDYHFYDNGEAHHTGRYELMTRDDDQTRQLVIRRGQTFRLTVELSRPFNQTTDKLAFTFTLDAASRPNVCNETFVLVPLETEIKYPKSWNAVGKSEENKLHVEIITPPDCIVGIWSFGISTEVTISNASEAYCLNPETKMYILFNTWCEDDQVYLENEDERQEYVGGDNGYVWKNGKSPLFWTYDQFVKDILDCAMKLMTDIAEVPLINCNDPVKVSRGLSSAVNSNNNNGVLVGRWYEPYDKGVKPWDWSKSSDILHKYYYDNSCHDPVSYGQCWVFACVLTTVCRALGLPARNVTTYDSAHDHEGNLTIDFVFDEGLSRMDDLTVDSDWNFHVWNEVWMKRPDLSKDGADYDGWNAIDSTPQEVSEGLSRCGPASVKAIQRGEVLLPYDTDFVFAEVNAVKNFWRYKGPNQPLKFLFSRTNGVGTAMITKKPGSYRPMNIVDSYKYNSEKPLKYFPGVIPKFDDKIIEDAKNKGHFDNVTIEVNLEEKPTHIGQPAKFKVVVANKSANDDYTVKLDTRVDSITYRGFRKAQILMSGETVVVKRASEHTSSFEIPYEKYFQHLVDQNQLYIHSVADVQETCFEYVATKIMNVQVPEIRIEPSSYVLTLGWEFCTRATFSNPLPTPLTNCKFEFEGVGVSCPVQVFINGPIQPYEVAVAEVNLTPQVTGWPILLVASFSCDQLRKAQGSEQVTVNTPGGKN